ncbi:hypothetical protein COU77_02660 [Candidatus Peregrinibacteria bacterium CG10_big_fil_rev_8_21_14_0_10_49_16]|nr:MAG: hypothetical protein COW95_02170 [Candidatus Peregrinibacteria bacterium CG22_combo_CG10-13_8_21_14_all_49_11]PIR51942.1 MAG: hypothetical protein COU77_02660 [Candidatus Peregrinibacteria bacterium CG10_big_fil_rev_8_21_14_0_10_49_16]
MSPADTKSETPEKKAPSTVRKRKSQQVNATQRYLPIGEIRNDTISLKNGGLRAVLQVEAINFNLKSETEQEAIIAGYGSFVNTLSFPVQIIVRSTHINIDSYLKYLQGKAQEQTNELLQEQTFAYIAFINRLLEVSDIMQKRFYVIVPYDKSERKKTLLEKFFDWLHPEDSVGKAAQRFREFNQFVKKLNERVELIEAGLGNIGLHTSRLRTRELIDLYYNIYNPETSQRQKIPENLEDLKMDDTTL